MADDATPSHRIAGTRFRLERLAACRSTQDVAAGLRGDVCVWADAQSAGRGRNGRTWSGEPRRDVEVTFRVEGPKPRRPDVLPAGAPTAAPPALEPLLAEPLVLEWPNDVLARGRKLSGILIDANGREAPVYLIGIGANVNRTDFPPELRESATSLALVAGRTFDRGEVAFRLAAALDRFLTAVEAGDVADYERLFCAHLRGVGRAALVTTAGGVLADDIESADFEALHLRSGRRVPLALVRDVALA